jgi:hypothetical protein
MLRLIDLPAKLPLLASNTDAVVGLMPSRPSSIKNVQNQGKPRIGICRRRHADRGLEAVAVFHRPVYQPLKMVICRDRLLIAILVIALKALSDNAYSKVVEALGNGAATKRGASSTLTLNSALQAN